MSNVLRLSGGLCVVMAMAGCLPEDGAFPLTLAPAVTPVPAPMSEPAPLCSPGVYAGIIGEPAAAADAVPAPKRILGPGDAATTDYNASRTNVEVDGNDIIRRVFCG